MAKKYEIKATLKGRDEASGVFARVGRGLVKHIGHPLSSIRAGVGGIHKGLVALPGAAMIAGAAKDAVTGLAEFVGDFANAADSVSKTARRVGLGTAALQELHFAGQLAGLSVAEMTPSLEAFNKGLGQLKGGTGRLSAFLKKVAPDLRAELRAQTDVNTALEIYLDAMSKMQDPTKRAALGLAAFGTTGQKMALLIENGTDVLAQQRREAHKYGAVLDDEALRASEAFNDELLRLKTGWAGLKSVFGAALIKEGLPHLLKLNKWIDENRGKVFELARSFAGDLVTGIQDVANAMPAIGRAFSDVVNGVKDGIKWFGDAYDTLKHAGRVAAYGAQGMSREEAEQAAQAYEARQRGKGNALFEYMNAVPKLASNLANASTPYDIAAATEQWQEFNDTLSHIASPSPEAVDAIRKMYNPFAPGGPNYSGTFTNPTVSGEVVVRVTGPARVESVKGNVTAKQSLPVGRREVDP